MTRTSRLASDRSDDERRAWKRAAPYGKRLTIRELLRQTSGMIDDNDIQARPK